MIDLLSEITLDDLPDEQLDIAEVVGIEAYKKLVVCFGGNDIRILKQDTLIKDKRDSMIRTEYTGTNTRGLARKFHLSDRSIRYIVGQQR